MENQENDIKIQAQDSDILNDIIKRAEYQKELVTKWAQNWNAHTNHNNNSAIPDLDF